MQIKDFMPELLSRQERNIRRMPKYGISTTWKAN